MIDREDGVSDPRLRRLNGRGLADQHPDGIRYRPEPRPYVIEVQAESRWSLKRILAWMIGVPLFAFATLSFLGSRNPNPARDAARTARDAVAVSLKTRDLPNTATSTCSGFPPATSSSAAK